MCIVVVYIYCLLSYCPAWWDAGDGLMSCCRCSYIAVTSQYITGSQLFMTIAAVAYIQLPVWGGVGETYNSHHRRLSSFSANILDLPFTKLLSDL